MDTDLFDISGKLVDVERVDDLGDEKVFCLTIDRSEYGLGVEYRWISGEVDEFVDIFKSMIGSNIQISREPIQDEGGEDGESHLQQIG